MKTINFLFFNLICVTLLGQQLPFDNEFQHIVKSEQNAAISKISSVASINITDYHITYHRCEWKADPAVNFISGTITSYFKPLTTGFDSILFNLSDSLKVDSIKYHNSILGFTHTGNIINIPLPAVITANTLDSISVFYKGVPPSTGFGSFIQTTHSGKPIIWTLSEPYGASDWWPCKNSLTDKADSVDIIVTCPIGNSVASNGLLVSEITTGPNKVFHWKHRHKIATYLICFAVTNYARYSDFVPSSAGVIPVLNMVYPEDSATAVTQTPDIIPVMQLYDTLFGTYPFAKEKYGHAQFGWGGGMEHQTMTFITNYGHELMAHELGHQWFGDKVTCASWRDIWLNEGFATYLSGLTYEHMFNGIYWMNFKKGRINHVTSQPGGSVWCDDTTSVNRIFDSRLTYNKGAMILHQLRWVIGDSAFFKAINNYLDDVNLAYGIARTADLKSHFEASSGQNLSWYFNDWFTGQGFPSYSITWNQVGSQVNITVNQNQSHASVPFFELPIPIELKGTIGDTMLRLNNTVSGQVFNIPVSFQVDSLKFDPELWLISSNNTITSIEEELLLKYCSVYPNPAKEKIQINFSKQFSSMQVKLIDVTGREIKSVSANGLKSLELGLEGISPGIYFVRFISENNSAVQKVAIQ